MFNDADVEFPVSVVAAKDIIVDIMTELLLYEDVTMDYCEMSGDNEYDYEYLLTLFYDEDNEKWYFGVIHAYDVEKEKYISIDGLVLFHEDTNSKAQVQMMNGKILKPSKCGWFSIGEEEDIDDDDSNYSVDVKDDSNKPSMSKTTYVVNGKKVGEAEYRKAVEKINDSYLNNIKEMLLRYSSFMDEVNDFMRVFQSILEYFCNILGLIVVKSGKSFILT